MERDQSQTLDGILLNVIFLQTCHLVDGRRSTIAAIHYWRAEADLVGCKLQAAAIENMETVWMEHGVKCH